MARKPDPLSAAISATYRVNRNLRRAKKLRDGGLPALGKYEIRREATRRGYALLGRLFR